jgi:DNA-directed RNA polymerase specialized sigma24 family protein
MLFFGGMTEDEAAESLGVSTRTVKRDWRSARAWLHVQMAEPPREFPR